MLGIGSKDIEHKLPEIVLVKFHIIYFISMFPHPFSDLLLNFIQSDRLLHDHHLLLTWCWLVPFLIRIIQV